MKRIPEKSKVEVLDMSPESIAANTAFREKTMDMRIPLKIPAKSMKNADKARSKKERFIEFMKHTKNNTANSEEKKSKKRAVMKEEGP